MGTKELCIIQKYFDRKYRLHRCQYVYCDVALHCGNIIDRINLRSKLQYVHAQSFFFNVIINIPPLFEDTSGFGRSFLNGASRDLCEGKCSVKILNSGAHQAY